MGKRGADTDSKATKASRTDTERDDETRDQLEQVAEPAPSPAGGGVAAAPLFGSDPFTPVAPKTFAKAQSKSAPGGIDARFKMQGVVVSAVQDGSRQKVKMFVSPEGVFGPTVDYASHAPFSLAIPVSKGPTPLEKIAAPRMVSSSPQLPQLITVTGVVEPSAYCNGKEVDPLPQVGDVVQAVNVEATLGNSPSLGSRGFLNCARFTVIERPADRAKALVDAVHAGDAAVSSLLGLATAAGMCEPSDHQVVQEQQDALRKAVRAAAAVLSGRFEKTAAAIEAVVDEAGGEPEQGQALAIKAMREWHTDFQRLADPDLCPFATMRDAVSFRPTQFMTIPATLAVYGVTPTRSYDEGMSRILALKGASRLDVPDHPMIGVRPADVSVSPSGGKLDLSFLPYGVADPRSFVDAGGDHTGLLAAKQVTGGPYRLAIKTCQLGNKVTTMYKDRVVVVCTELAKYADMIFTFKCTPLEASQSQQEIEGPFADHFWIDMPSTLAKLLPSLSLDEVATILGGVKVIVPDALAAREPVTSFDASGPPVKPTTFATTGILPLQESGIDLKNLEKVATEQGGVVRFAAVYPGSMAAAWADGVDRGKDGVALELLTKAADDAGFKGDSAIESFITEDGVIYAYIAKPAAE